MTTKKAKSEKQPIPMELLQDLIEAGAEVKDLTITIAGQEITIKYRELTWLEKSKVLSEALEYSAIQNEKGETILQVKLHHDIYRREVLRLMVVNSPIPFTKNVLDKLPSSVGEQLEKIIPSPFSSEQAAALKKEPASSSEEPDHQN